MNNLSFWGKFNPSKLTFLSPDTCVLVLCEFTLHVTYRISFFHQLLLNIQATIQLLLPKYSNNNKVSQKMTGQMTPLELTQHSAGLK